MALLLTCSRCRAPIDTYATYCVSCYAPLGPDSLPVAAASEMTPPRQRTKRGVTRILKECAVFLALIILFAANPWVFVVAVYSLLLCVALWEIQN